MNFKVGQQVRLRRMNANHSLRHHYGTIFTVRRVDNDFVDLVASNMWRTWFAWRMEPVNDTPQTWFEEG